MELFKIFGTIGLKGQEQFSKDIDSATNKGQKLANALGKGLRTAAKVGAVAVTAATATVGALLKTSIDSYAEYEQLVGGVDTLFKASSQKVQEYAANAYKTAGLSANDYMATVTSFSASLLQSLSNDTEAAAEYANKALIDMSDNANKMGTDMASIQNAYQGFAKQNYTMLDNLKLGYGGTQTEMQRLIAEAAKLSNTVDAQSMSFANIVEAIHVVQTEMGITGTTMLEASETISGSIASVKGAWSNLATGIADDNADMDALINNFVESVGTAAENLVPRIGTALNGVSKLISKTVPILVKQIPQLISKNLPVIAEAAVGIIQSLVDGISENQESLMPVVFDTIVFIAESFLSMLPQIVELGLELIVSLADGISQSLPTLIPTIVDVILQIVTTLTSPDTVTSLTGAAIEIILALTNGLIEALPVLIEALPEIIVNLVAGLIENAPQLIEAALILMVTLSLGLVEATGELLVAAVEIVLKFGEYIAESAPELIEQGKTMVANIKEGVLEKWEEFKTWFTETWENLWSEVQEIVDEIVPNLVEKWEELEEKLTTTMATIQSNVSSKWETIKSDAETKVSSIVSTVEEKFSSVKNSITEKIEDARDKVREAIDAIKGFFDFEISWPHVPLPHFSITPAGWKLGDLLEGIVPSLGIQWYAKGGILDKPTVFGINGNNLMVGGEAGKEAVAPIDTLQAYVAAAVASQNEGLIIVLSKILDAIIALDENMGGNLREALDGVSLDVNNREFARLVRGVI